ncbi:unnamed protein product [Triticum turgidum subsp. durum]|uniref:Ubiquitin-like-conjugating enzyme ATG10 n=1 Tax=Triticum turgidum subsp. durum TaxID=4567 RepID=A0A9R1PT43_TRITD|nr:unnamed protein product [Triticum turgidum subsp. durum]
MFIFMISILSTAFLTKFRCYTFKVFSLVCTSQNITEYLLPLFSFLIANVCNLSLGGQLLTLDEIKKDLPSHSLQLLNESKWTFITREEHPHLSRPWFTLHPCGTSDWMKLLLHKLGDKDRSLQYLSAWLSVAGQAVGLKIPLKLYCSS